MKVLRVFEVNNLEPKNKNVLWVDTSKSTPDDKITAKIHNNGEWKTLEYIDTFGYLNAAQTKELLKNYILKSSGEVWLKGTGTNSRKVFNTSVASGLYSVSMGDKTKATGGYSYAEGVESEATGLTAHAEGMETKAFGNYSHAEGKESIAEGVSSHAEGEHTKTESTASHAEGYQTQALGDYSHAEGEFTTAESKASHAEGTGTRTEATSAHAEGEGTVASGPNGSHAEGLETIAQGACSHAEGENTKAEADCSHAEGSSTKAYGQTSHTEGDGTSTGLFDDDGNYVDGDTGDNAYSILSGTAAHAEGSNTNAAGPSSHSEGQNTKAIGEGSHSEGKNTIANGTVSHAEGCYTTASGDCSHAEGENTEAVGNYSHAEGSDTTARGDCSHAEGSNTTARGDFSHAEGSNTEASEDYSHAEGLGTSASGESSHAEGFYTTASEDYSHAEGSNTTASGESSHAEGSNTTASGDFSHAEGYYTSAYNPYMHVQGKYNEFSTNTDDEPIQDDLVDVVAWGTSNSNRKNLETLDSDGNKWIRGEVRWGGSSWASGYSIPPANHASSVLTYGKGSDTLYGHLKLSDALDSTSDSTAGIAATPKAVKLINDKFVNYQPVGNYLTASNAVTSLWEGSTVGPLTGPVQLVAGNGISIVTGVSSVSGSFVRITNTGNTSGEGEGMYILPTATSTTLGGIKIGSHLSIDDDGVVSSDYYTLPNANATTLGGVKLVDTVNNTDGISSNKAVTPSGVNSAINTAVTAAIDALDIPTNSVSLYDMIITTADQLVELANADSSIVSVAIVGNITCTGEIVIPNTVKRIDGYKNATITCDKSQQVSYYMGYASEDENRQCTISNLTLSGVGFKNCTHLINCSCTGNNYVGFTHCHYLENCTSGATWSYVLFEFCTHLNNCRNIEESSSSTIRVTTFKQCTNLRNCLGTQGIAFKNCNILQGCTGTGGNGTSASNDGYNAFEYCSNLTNCKGIGGDSYEEDVANDRGDGGHGFYRCNSCLNCYGTGGEGRSGGNGFSGHPDSACSKLTQCDGTAGESVGVTSSNEPLFSWGFYRCSYLTYCGTTSNTLYSYCLGMTYCTGTIDGQTGETSIEDATTCYSSPFNSDAYEAAYTLNGGWNNVTRLGD